MCRINHIPITEPTTFELTDLDGDTYYRIELRAHNAIGYSRPISFLLKTARGESPNHLGSLLYSHGAYGSSTSISQRHSTDIRGITLFVCSLAIVSRLLININY